MKIATGRLARYRKYLAKGLLPHKILQMLGAAGIVIQPYHFYLEEPAGRSPSLRDADPTEYEFAEAGPDDADGIAALDPKIDSRPQIRDDFNRGRRAFVLRKEGTIVAVTWCDTAEIGFLPCRRALSGDEAYLYGMETAYEHRGHEIAPFLRWKALEYLARSGRRHVYSYSDYFNRPALRFKEKIGARIMFTGLYLGIWGIGGRNWILRTRAAPDRGP
jgi:hypothetical protein